MNIAPQNPANNQSSTVFKKDSNQSLSHMGNAIPAAAHLDALRDEFRRTLSKVNFIDQLTDLYNRRYFDKVYREIWYSQQDSKECLSLILCDIDYLKSYNNMYGYQFGNQVLRLVAEELAKQLKSVPNSIVARYGADCFAILLPNSLIDDALLQTETMLEAIKSLAIPSKASTVADVVTASFGIASTYPRPHLLYQDFFENAKTALDEAKAQGRNAAYTLPPAWSQEYILNANQ